MFSCAPKRRSRRRRKPGEKALKSVEVSPEYHFIRICQEELTALMGNPDGGPTEMNWAKKGPTVFMLVGLQGSGKTTTAGKLARWLQKIHKRKPPLVAADIYRPAAVQQLQVLGEQLGITVFTQPGKSPPEICDEATAAHTKGYEVVILDTAGRLAIDEPLMAELEQIRSRVKPHETFLVVDAMIGQDAVNTAKTFHERIHTTGFVLTKLDGDARRARPFDPRSHRSAGALPGHGREPREARRVPSRGPVEPHPGHGRHRRPDEGL